MKQWIEQDLQQNTRTFTIAYFHQPPYSKGSHDSDDAFELVMKARSPEDFHAVCAQWIHKLEPIKKTKGAK